MQEKERIDSLLKITFDYITKPCKNVYNREKEQKEDINWNEASLFCLAFKTEENLFTKRFYWSMCNCNPIKCIRYSFDLDHQKVAYKIGEQWDHCIKFDCD